MIPATAAGPAIGSATATAEWAAIGTTARVVVTSPRHLDAARAIAHHELAALDRACSRFRSDSEIAAIVAADGEWTTISDVLVKILACALAVAERTKGDVDPTMGADLARLGYDRDFGELVHVTTSVGDTRFRLGRRPSWRDVELDPAGRKLRVPRGVQLDLGAVAKAWCADRCAWRIADELGIGVLVGLGGDIATAGDGPDVGWLVRVQDLPGIAGGPACTVRLDDGFAIATSSTVSRSWRRGTSTLHHILDPATRRPAHPVWRTVTVVAATCVEANTESTAAIVRGLTAPRFLAGLGLPARLVDAHGVVRRVGGWPRDVV